MQVLTESVCIPGEMLTKILFIRIFNIAADNDGTRVFVVCRLRISLFALLAHFSVHLKLCSIQVSFPSKFPLNLKQYELIGMQTIFFFVMAFRVIYTTYGLPVWASLEEAAYHLHVRRRNLNCLSLYTFTAITNCSHIQIYPLFFRNNFCKPQISNQPHHPLHHSLRQRTEPIPALLKWHNLFNIVFHYYYSLDIMTISLGFSLDRKIPVTSKLK